MIAYSSNKRKSQSAPKTCPKKVSPFSRPLSTAKTFLRRDESRNLDLTARLLARTEYAPSVFVPAVTDPKVIRTSHPSGSRHWGCSARRSHPAPGSYEPQKIVSALACPSAAGPDSQTAPPAGVNPGLFRPESPWRVALSALEPIITDRWLFIQPLAGS